MDKEIIEAIQPTKVAKDIISVQKCGTQPGVYNLRTRYKNHSDSDEVLVSISKEELSKIMLAAKHNYDKELALREEWVAKESTAYWLEDIENYKKKITRIKEIAKTLEFY